MARSFGGGTDGLQYNAAVLTTYPRTYFCRFRRTIASGSNHGLIAQGTSGGAQPRDAISIVAAGTVSFVASDGTATTINTTNSVTTNQWHTAIGEAAAANNRSIWLDNAGLATSAVSRSNTPNLTAIGVNVITLNTLNTGHEIAEACIWSATLNADERAALQSGVSPLLIKPASIVSYWKLIGRYSPEIDLKSGNNLTVTGTTAVAHPRVFYPRRVYTILRTLQQVLAAGGNTATFTNPTGTLTPGSVNLAAGQNLVTFSNPAVTLINNQTLLAGTNTVLFTNPDATIIPDQFLAAGSQTVLFTNPTAFVVTAGTAQVPRGMRYRAGSVLHWIWGR